MSDDLPPTPEGRLIRRAREAIIPKLTIRAAAARIGMSSEQWGYAERGYTPRRGTDPARTFHPPAATLARMAQAVRLTPKRLAEEGQRPDAADFLREVLGLLESPPGRVPDLADDDEGKALQRIMEDERLPVEWRRAMVALAEILKRGEDKSESESA